jgi:prepilin-type N-terminal cleavage/methylation domain-containing protein
MCKSFTLIEILVVIVVIGIISSFIVIGISSISDKANISKGKIFIDSVENNLLLNRISYWKLDGNGNDSWGINNLTVNGVTEDGSCVSGSCYFFDGTTADYLIINPINNFPVDQFSISVWVNSSNASTEGSMVSYASTHSDNELLFYLYGSTISIYAVFQATGFTVNDGKWHNIFFTWRNTDGSVRFYKDGGLLSSNTLSIGNTMINGGSLVFGQEQDNIGGGFSSTQAFLGKMDEIKIYNMFLSSSMVKENYYSDLNKLYKNNSTVLEEFKRKVVELK